MLSVVTLVIPAIGYNGFGNNRRPRATFLKFARDRDLRLADLVQERRPGEERPPLIGPALVELLKQLPGRDINVVIVAGLWVFSENNLIQDLMVWSLRRRGVQVVPMTELRHLPMEYSQNEVTRLLAILDRFDSDMRLRRATQARNALRTRKGKLEGRKPYGFRDGEHRALERMKELRRQGKSFAAIATALADEGFRPRGSKEKTPKAWQPRTINRILARIGMNRMSP